jgi:uncharacterized protein (DUF2342 family)
MSEEDLFSQLFELFNQPGPVNWKLGMEVARHLSGERQPIEPWAAEEFRELARLAEYRLEGVAPFRLQPAADVLPLDPRTWAEKNLESYAALVEPFAASIGGEGPAGRSKSTGSIAEKSTSGSWQTRSPSGQRANSPGSTITLPI